MSCCNRYKPRQLTLLVYNYNRVLGFVKRIVKKDIVKYAAELARIFYAFYGPLFLCPGRGAAIPRQGFAVSYGLEEIFMDLYQRSASLLKILQSGMHEREEAITLGFICAVAGESLFLLGPPGTAKSLTARRLKYAFADADIRHFEYLMGKFSTPEELFGPISVQGLKQDRYERKTEGYLPTAHIVFLDEIWKSGPAIQNTLLTVINEKVYRNGPQEQKLPLELLVAASNELPGPGLDALWDRFLVRLYVGNIESEEKLCDLLGQFSDPYADPFAALDGEQQALRLSLKELKGWQAQIREIEVPQKLRQILLEVKKRLQLYNEELARQEQQKGPEEPEGEAGPAEARRPFYLSDRRLLKVVHLLRTSAFLHGRSEVGLTDLVLLPYCLWDSEEQMVQARRLVGEVLEQHAFSAGGFALRLKNLGQSIEEHLEEVQQEQDKGPINPRLQQDFKEEKQRLFAELESCRQDLAGQRQEQG